MSKLSSIEQHAPIIRSFYFRDRIHRNREYDNFMKELESFSFTTKNLHDDGPDSLAMLCDFLYSGVRSVKAYRNPFSVV